MVMFYPTAAIVTTMELIYQAQTAAEGTDNSLDLALSATQACAVFALAAAAILTRRLPAPEPKGYTVCFTRKAVNQPCGNSQARRPTALTGGLSPPDAADQRRRGRRERGGTQGRPSQGGR